MADYCAKFTYNEADREYLVTFPDLPEAITAGKDMAEAFAQAVDCLETAIYFRLRDGEDIPAPGKRAKGLKPVPLSPLLAAKVAVHAAFRDSGMTRVALAAALGVDEAEVRRILNPQHATKINRIDDALRAMGKRLAVSVEAA